MNLNEYRNAYRYASKFTKDYLDVVHDAYLDYKINSKNDLFDQPNSIIIAVVRKQYNKRMGTNKNRYWWRGYRGYTTHYSFNDEPHREGVIESTFKVHTEDATEAVHVNLELERINSYLNARQKHVLDMSIKGYRSSDIAKMEGVNRSSVSKTLRIVQSKVKQLR